MKLTLAAVASVLLCFSSLVARSWAMRAAERAPAVEATPQEKVALAAVDGHLRAKLRKLSRH